MAHPGDDRGAAGATAASRPLGGLLGGLTALSGREEAPVRADEIADKSRFWGLEERMDYTVEKVEDDTGIR